MIQQGNNRSSTSRLRVLGSLLFLAYPNDINLSSKISSFIRFEDDTVDTYIFCSKSEICKRCYLVGSK